MASPARSAFGGHWQIESDHVVQTTRATYQPLGPTLLFGDPAWKDFEITVEAMPFEGGGDGFKVLFRVQDESNLCGVGFGSYRNQSHDIWKVVDRQWKRFAGGQCSVPGQVEYGVWHHIRICATGNRFSCDFNGIPLFEAKDSTYSHGLIGLSTWDTLVRFRNIRVRDLRGETIWQGLPTLQSTS